MGGIAGEINGSAIENCYNTGNIRNKGSSVRGCNVYAGGIVGATNRNNENKISNSYNMGSVNGEDTERSYTGGIVGEAYSCAITDCYNIGNISSNADDSILYGGISRAGGIVGVISSSVIQSKIDNCYNVGNISCSSGENNVLGAIIGYFDIRNNDVLSNCYWNISSNQTSISTYKDEVSFDKKGIGYIRYSNDTVDTTPMTTSDMKSMNFVNILNSDAGENTIWYYDRANVNDGYPNFNEENIINSVSFDLCGAPGLPPATQYILKGYPVVIPYTPVWDGYMFDGWYTNKQYIGEAFFTGSLSFINSIFNESAGGSNIKLMRGSNLTLYAKWRTDDNRIIFGVDTYKFNNYEWAFDEKYIINDEYYDILKDYTKDHNLAMWALFDFATRKNGKWIGSCYGMATSNALQKMGLLDVAFFQQGAKTPYNLDLPKNNKTIMSLVNFYMFSQKLPNLSEKTVSKKKSQSELLQDLVESAGKVKTGGTPVIVTIEIKETPKSNWGQHAIIAYDVKETLDCYEVKIAENRRYVKVISEDPLQVEPYTHLIMKISKDYTSCSYDVPKWDGGKYEFSSNNSTLKIDYLQTKVDDYNSLNLQQELIKRGETQAYAMSAVTKIEPKTAELTVNYDNFTIANENGLHATVVNGDKIEGDLEITEPEALNDFGMPLLYRYYLNGHVKYTITPQDTIPEYNTSIFYNGNDGCFSVAITQNSSTIEFNPTGKVATISDMEGFKTLATTINSSTTPWYTTQITGNLVDLSLTPSDDNTVAGSSQTLESIEIVVKNDKVTVPLTLNTNENAVVIKNIGQHDMDYTNLIPHNGIGIDNITISKQNGEILVNSPLLYSVSFRTYGGSCIDTINNLTYNSTISKPEDPTLEAYIFAGWYKDAECTDGQEWDFDNDMVTDGITLHAKWIYDKNYMHKVVFRSEGNDDIIILVRNGGTITEIPPVPKKDGFKGQWNYSEFYNIISDIVVNPVYTDNFDFDAPQLWFNGEVVTTLFAGSNTITMDINKNIPRTVLILGIYNKEDKLIGIINGDEITDYQEMPITLEARVNFTQSQLISGQYVKVFVWEDINNMIPYKGSGSKFTSS